MVVDEETLARKFADLWPHLNERQRRLVVGAEAKALGRGGVTVAARAAGVSRPTVAKALGELAEPPVEIAPMRSRRAGGGRKRAVARDPGLVEALEALVDPESRGDPESPLRWTCKSTRQLAGALCEAGHPVSHVRVADILHGLGYSLQGNVKTREGKQHPDRDAQFQYINKTVKARLRRGLPVLSVDTKKKELVGEEPGYKNGGQEWQPKATPVEVGVHDFPDPAVGKAVPYGVYDVGANAGWVLVGSDADTAAFAVQALRRWWDKVGCDAYPDADKLLLCADAGGSNSYRTRLWKTELSALATETGLTVTVCHFPPGTSKWNKIEHRLFSMITMNWRGRPLTSHEVIVELIGATTSKTGLKVQAELDRGVYPKGIKVSDAELAAAGVRPHKFHGEWNYDLRPQPKITTT
ncbi:MAG: ISAzo13 family transposase [Acidimicrobiia bacterium]